MLALESINFLMRVLHVNTFERSDRVQRYLVTVPVAATVGLCRVAVILLSTPKCSQSNQPALKIECYHNRVEGQSWVSNC